MNSAILHLSKNRNFLHACGVGNQLHLFTDICLDSGVNESTIKIALNQKNAAGHAPIHVCNNQQVVLKIIEKIPCIDLDHLFKKFGLNVELVLLLVTVFIWLTCQSLNNHYVRKFLDIFFVKNNQQNPFSHIPG